jgi:hypothetical protein
MTERYTSDSIEPQLPRRIREFAEVAVRPFDDGAVAARAIADGTAPGRRRGPLAARWIPTPSVLVVLTMIVLVSLILATLLAASVAGPQREVGSFHLGQLAYSESGDVFLANADGSDPWPMTDSTRDGLDYELVGWPSRGRVVR